MVNADGAEGKVHSPLGGVGGVRHLGFQPVEQGTEVKAG
jgi:hypothetical protein